MILLLEMVSNKARICVTGGVLWFLPEKKTQQGKEIAFMSVYKVLGTVLDALEWDWIDIVAVVPL